MRLKVNCFMTLVDVIHMTRHLKVKFSGSYWKSLRNLIVSIKS